MTRALLLGRLLFDVARFATVGVLVLAVCLALGVDITGGVLGVARAVVLLAPWHRVHLPRPASRGGHEPSHRSTPTPTSS